MFHCYLLVICKHLSTYRQEDAHEFLRYLIESMERCYLSVLGHAAKSYVYHINNNKNIIHIVFYYFML